MFAVDDLDAAVISLQELGIASVGEFDGSICRMATIDDTEGNLTILHKRTAESKRARRESPSSLLRASFKR